ncbi:MAG: DMT family transporter [Gammaproteobacteria bacterium]|nr:DMT family transporter [Gammaproteobacteria bacterium]
MTGSDVHHPLRGVLFFMAGIVLFACMDTATKYLAARYEAPVVVAIRYLVHCLLMVIVLAPSQGRKLVQTQRTGLVLVRAACLAFASLFFALALQRMPVAEASAVVFLSPLLVVLAAGLLLDERVGLTGWVAAIAGFGGVLLIAHPGAGLDAVGIVFALCAAVLTASYQLLSRLLAHTEQTLPMLFYTGLVGAVGYGLSLPWFWGGERATPWILLLFLSIGTLAGVGHFLYTAAHRHAPASVLAPLQYAQLVWAGLLGWIAFSHVPDRLSILGMGVVASAGTLVTVRSRMAARALEQASET